MNRITLPRPHPLPSRRTHRSLAVVFVQCGSLLGFLALLASAPTLFAQTTAFTYQGRLTDNGAPANGNYDLLFTLRDALTAGNTLGSPYGVSPVGVTNGLFTVTMDFGTGVFAGANRWLEISVRTNGTAGAFTALAPRQPITATPYAIQALTAASATTASSAATANSVSASGITGTLGDAALSANVALLNGSPVFTGTVTASSFIGKGALVWQTISGIAQQAAANTGYLATNDAVQVTVTLPSSPNVGDVVRVTGAGVGGWTVAQNAGQSVLGGNVSFVGVPWVAREVSRQWWPVASSADGSKLVAAVQNGQIYTSTDSGANWMARDSNRDWTSVASSADGSKLVAVVYGGQIYTSTDSGANWTARDSSRGWVSVASSSDGSKLVAVVGGGGGRIYTSADSGVTWTARESSRVWYSVASSADGSKLVATTFDLTRYADRYVCTSTDSGVTWTVNLSTDQWSSVASSADGSKLVAMGGGTQNTRIYTSTDSGANWIPRDSIRTWYSVASSANGNKLVAVERSGQIYTSSDSGVTWTPHESSRDWRAVACSADGNKLVATVLNGQIYTWIGTTTPGTAGNLTGGQSTCIELQYIGNGQFLPISYVGMIYGY